MLKVLYLTPGLDYCGTTTRLGLIAAGLSRDRFAPHVCVLGKGGAGAGQLRAAGVPVDVLGWTRWFDVNPLRRLKRLVETLKPEVIHLWWPSSLRAVTLPRCYRRSRLVLSDRLERSQAIELLRWPCLLLLRQVEKVVVATKEERGRWQQLGVAEEKLVVIRPGTVLLQSASEKGTGPFDAPEGRRRHDAAGGVLSPFQTHSEIGETNDRDLLPRHGLPSTARFVVCAGPLEPHKGFKDAIWAFDMLQFLYDDLHLVLVGEGTDRPRLEQFAKGIGAPGRVHFVGRQPSPQAWMSQAELVWVPSLKEGGLQVALEGMAGARPVVATNLPALAELVVEGETGYLVAPGDKVALARRTRLLLDDPDLRDRLGAAARKRVEEHFSAANQISRHAEVYEMVAQRG